MVDDLEGKIFGQLTVLDKYKRIKYKTGSQIYLLCRCSCGTEKYISRPKLKSGHTKSCGCYRNKFRRTNKAARVAIFDEYKRGASSRELAFELTIEQFVEIAIKPCHYYGVIDSKERQTKRKSDVFKYNGIDRLDNKIGYIYNNCVPCCKFCNRAKDRLSEQEFLEKIYMIVSYRGAQ